MNRRMQFWCVGLAVVALSTAPAGAQTVSNRVQAAGGAMNGTASAVTCDARIPIDSIPFTIAVSGSYYLTASLPGLPGESGMATIQETALRIAGAAGVSLAETGIIFSDGVPHLGDAVNMAAASNRSPIKP